MRVGQVDATTTFLNDAPPRVYAALLANSKGWTIATPVLVHHEVVHPLTICSTTRKPNPRQHTLRRFVLV
jgi:hypothetical protein